MKIKLTESAPQTDKKKNAKLFCGFLCLAGDVAPTSASASLVGNADADADGGS